MSTAVIRAAAGTGVRAGAGIIHGMSELAIEVRGLRKSYGEFEAVRGIDFEVRRGEVFGLLGPNGAGKTTTVEILEGYRKRSGGTVTVLGFDPGERSRSLRARVGIVLQSTGIYRHIRVREALEHFAGMYPHPRDVSEVIALTGLESKERALARTLSGGQLRRLDLALALVGDPELIFLDEPTTGFDPAARREAWAMINGLKALGKTVFLTTHYMDEAQHLADRVAILRAGKIVALGRPSELGSALRAETVVSFRTASTANGGAPGLEELRAAVDPAAELAGGAVTVRTADPQPLLRRLLDWADGCGVRLDELEVRRPDLEDVFLELVGGDAPAEPARGGDRA